MRVLIVVHGVPVSASGGVGGTELYALGHARALMERHGVGVLVVARENDPARADYTLREASVDGVRCVLVNNTFASVRSFSETYANEAIDAVVSRVVDEFRPDLAHVHHLTGLSTGIVTGLSSRGVPCVVTLHDYWLICHRGQLLDTEGRQCGGPEPSGCARCLGAAAGAGGAGFAAASVVRALERQLPAGAGRVVRTAAGRVGSMLSVREAADRAAAARLEHMQAICERVTHFIAPSRAIRDRFVSFGVPSSRISVSGYGVDPAPYRGLSRSTADRVRFGFLGSVMLSKGPHLLLQAFSRLEPGTASLDIYGAVSDYHGDRSLTGMMAPWLDRPGVRMHGAISHERVPKILADLDVLVVPSIWAENSPFVIREAFLAGIPVVASRTGGIPELVTNGVNGILVPPGDVDAVHHALEQIAANPSLVTSLRAAIPEVRTLEDDVAGAVAVYETCLRPKREAHPAERRGTAAIIVNYQTPDQTVLAVRSALRSRHRLDPIVVVDNSDEESLRSVDRLDPRVVYLGGRRNLGFSGGVNAGIRAAFEEGATRMLLVNSDAILPPDCLEQLESAMDNHAGAGVVAPTLIDRRRPDQIASRGLSFQSGTGRMRDLSAGASILEVAVASNAPTRVDAVSGGVMLIDGRVLERIGLFDESYFFSFEDLDFCLRARAAGFETLIVPGAVAYHEGGRSIGSRSTSRLYFAARNHLRLARRVAPAGRWQSLRRDVSIVALNLAHAALRAGGGTVVSRLSAVVRGTRDHAAGRFGAGS